MSVRHFCEAISITTNQRCKKSIQSGCTIEVAGVTFYFCGTHNVRFHDIFQAVSEGSMTQAEAAVAFRMINKEENKVEDKQDFVVMVTGARELVNASKEIREAAHIGLAAEFTTLKEKYNLTVVTGLAEGFDELAAVLALELGVPYVVVMPNRSYGLYYWGQHSLLNRNRLPRYNELKDSASEYITVANTLYVRKPTDLNVPVAFRVGEHANMVRNTYMLDISDGVIVWDPTTSGTRDCYNKAVARGMKVHVLTNNKKEGS
jgi:hypothetical protein